MIREIFRHRRQRWVERVRDAMGGHQPMLDAYPPCDLCLAPLAAAEATVKMIRLDEATWSVWSVCKECARRLSSRDGPGHRD